MLDESGMTSDADAGRLLAAVERSGAKLIAVGDYSQLDAVGPGGALEALSKHHPDHVWTLRDNLRQVDPGERHALDHLRAGHVPTAVAWYLGQGRVHPAPSRAQATSDMVMAWAQDVVEGRDALMVAYHRDSVEVLNRAARAVWGSLGRLSGPELEAPGGRRYRAGDRVVTLAPGPGGAWVTSQRAVVTSVDIEAKALTAVTPEGAELHIGPSTPAPTSSGTPTQSRPIGPKVPPWTSPTPWRPAVAGNWPRSLGPQVYGPQGGLPQVDALTGVLADVGRPRGWPAGPPPGAPGRRHAQDRAARERRARSAMSGLRPEEVLQAADADEALGARRGVPDREGP